MLFAKRLMCLSLLMSVSFNSMYGAQEPGVANVVNTPLGCAPADNMIVTLHEAAAYGRQTRLEQLLAITQHKANINKLSQAPAYQGLSPLHVAVNWGHLDIVATLIAAGADVNLYDNVPTLTYKRTPLHWAIERQSFAIVRFLIDHGADIEKETTTNAFPWLDAYPLHIAARVGNLDIVRALLDKHAYIMRKDYSLFRFPLHYAALHNNTELLRALIEVPGETFYHKFDTLGWFVVSPHYWAGSKRTTENRLNYINYVDNLDWTPLSIAAKAGNTDGVRFLIDHGATRLDNALINALNAFNSNPQTHMVTIRALIDAGANVAAVTNSLPVALDHGATEELIRYLLAHNANRTGVTRGRSRWIDYPLHEAADAGNLEQVQRLLHSPNFHANMRDGVQATPLHLAALQGRLQVVEYLLQQGVTIDAANIQGLTPLYCAAEHGHAPVIRFLCEHGALVDSANPNRDTPLHVAVQNGHLEAVQTLIQLGATIGFQNIRGATPLLRAIWNNRQEIAKLLLNRGAPVNQRDPLQAAASENQSEIVNKLLEKHAPVTAEALEAAVRQGNQAIVVKLLENQPAATPQDIETNIRQAIEIAERNNQGAMAEFLRKRQNLVPATLDDHRQVAPDYEDAAPSATQASNSTKLIEPHLDAFHTSIHILAGILDNLTDAGFTNNQLIRLRTVLQQKKLDVLSQDLLAYLNQLKANTDHPIIRDSIDALNAQLEGLPEVLNALNTLEDIALQGTNRIARVEQIRDCFGTINTLCQRLDKQIHVITPEPSPHSQTGEHERRQPSPLHDLIAVIDDIFNSLQHLVVRQNTVLQLDVNKERRLAESMELYDNIRLRARDFLHEIDTNQSSIDIETLYQAIDDKEKATELAMHIEQVKQDQEPVETLYKYLITIRKYFRTIRQEVATIIQALNIAPTATSGNTQDGNADTVQPLNTTTTAAVSNAQDDRYTDKYAIKPTNLSEISTRLMQTALNLYPHIHAEAIAQQIFNGYQDIRLAFSGVPGNGKTTLAKAIAKKVCLLDIEAGRAPRDVYVISPANSKNQFKDSCEGSITATFEPLRNPTNPYHPIVIIDDMDALGRDADSRLSESKALNPYTEQFPVHVFATVNEPEKLESSLKSRFRILEIPEPTRQQLKKCLKVQLEEMPEGSIENACTQDASIEHIIELMAGTPLQRRCRQLIEAAGTIALTRPEGHGRIRTEDLLQAITMLPTPPSKLLKWGKVIKPYAIDFAASFAKEAVMRKILR